MLTFTSDTAAFSAELTGFSSAIQADFQALAQTMLKAGLERARDGLERSVYGTVPGRVYVRTGTLRDGVTGGVRASANLLTLSLQSRASYSSEIEYGSGPSGLSEKQVQDYSEATGGAVLFFGRSGLKYITPGPFLLPASVWALEVAKREFEAICMKRWK